MVKQPVPMLLVTGFLGAGKTTLINHLLAQGFDGRKVAVVVNDFGKVAVDASLIEHAGDDMLTLRNGCVCCTLAADLPRGLARLLDTGDYDMIVMETSGVTMVAPLRRILETPGLAELVELQQVVVVVDPDRYPKIRRIVVTLDEQVAHATLVIVNRCDLASPDQLAGNEAAIREVNGEVPIVQGEFGRVSFTDITAAATPPIAAPTVPAESADDWETCSIHLPGPVTESEIRALLTQLPEDVMRLKGFVTTPAGQTLDVQRVGTVLTVQAHAQPVTADARDTLVAIGPPPLLSLLQETLGDHDVIIRAGESTRLHHHHHPDQ